MTILFAPSEGKRPGGKLPPVDTSAFCFPELYGFRKEAMERYGTFVKNAPLDALKKLFGIKDEKLIERYRTDLFDAPTMKAVERYDGVAYDYLDYASLPQRAQRYVDEHLIIFSNLLGPVCASDRVPDYKLKQGESIGGFIPEKFYKAHFSHALDAYLEANGPIVDLRAGFYEKFYKISLPYITMKFLKNGKTVSHWAKAYRGTVLKEMAKHAIMEEKDLLAMDVEGLNILEIKTLNNKKEIVYDIVT
ncbi:YaaA family protein [Hydrogenimonas urashimensis]|uniref:YaaA family protein n=1 Tax=Hydrogenimonas urashimensis TaxID=2740515 RepID=UPI0019151BE0|nr:YaaA family protein [Hydrogenimonas urashimensis]